MKRNLADTLQKAPNDCWYAIEKIGEAMRGDGGSGIIFGEPATHVLLKIISDFKSATKELDEDWETNDELSYDLPEIEYAITQLGMFLRREESDIGSSRAGQIFLEFLQLRLRNLVDFAQSVDNR